MAVCVISNLAIDNLAWYPIVAPINCNYFSIVNRTRTISLRSNPTDPTTQDSIPLTSYEEITSPPTMNQQGSPRFSAGQITGYYVQDPGGASTAVLRFVL